MIPRISRQLKNTPATIRIASVLTSRRFYTTVASVALITGWAWTETASAQELAQADRTGNLETVVVTGTAFDPNVAPAKSSLETMEPQTIINKSYIEDSVAETGTYTTILAIAPSMTGSDLNGPGLSDGGVKNTLRGLPDGSFGINYDGIPFGDTNGPSHHSESYFPVSTIGSIDVDRGPGNAGNLGPSTYGGSINMFSEVLNSQSSARAVATYGSFNTSEFNANYQTGDMNLAGMNDRLLLNFQDTNTNGYLTYQESWAQNYLVKNQVEVAPGWTVTAFANYNGLFQQLEDNSGATAAQINTFGKNYALQENNPAAGTYAPYNKVHKKTDMDYLRLQGDLWHGITLDDTLYTYAYVNKTLSTTSVQQTMADIVAGITEGNGTIVNGKTFKTDVPGYTKQNAYRNWGNILRLSDDFDMGWLTGQVRGGIWWEDSTSQRARSDFDMTQCYAAGCNPWHSTTFADSRLLTGQKTPTSGPLFGGYFEYYEHSGWSEYQPFVEVELHPLPDLTITPGYKYVWWDHYLSAPLEQKSKPVVPAAGEFVTTHDLPFLMANYKIRNSWSVYAQYAQGIYIPDISAFEQSSPSFTFPKAETTTNYQFGTVYYADNFNIDADIYYIGVNNNIVEQPCNNAPIFGPPGETCALNTGTAIYKGVEGEGTYSFQGVFDGLALFLNGSANSSKSGGKWLKSAPMWTSASGLFYKQDNFKLSLIDKLVGQQYSDNADTPFYKLNAYNEMDFKGSVILANLEFSLDIANLLNSRSLASVGINDKSPIGGANVYDVTNRNSSLDQYYYQAGRSFDVTVKARF